MTKTQAIKQHIALREQFWGKYSMIKYAYGFFRCMLHKQSLIEGASEGLKRYIADYGTAENLRNKLK